MANEIQAVYDRYNKMLKDYRNEQQRKANNSKAEIDKMADDDLQQAYISYMEGKRKMPGELARMGLSGGASETSLLRANTGYETRRGNVNRGRSSDKVKIDENLRSTDAAYKLAHDQNLEAAVQQAQERVRQKQMQEEQRFAATVSGYDNINEIDKLLAYIKKSGVAPWRADHLRARRAELVKEQALKAQALAKSGGGGGSSRSGGGGGSSTTTTTGGGTPSSKDKAVQGALNAMKVGGAARSAARDILSGLKRSSLAIPYQDKVRGA